MKTLWTKLTLASAALALISPAMAASDYGYGQGHRYFDQRSETQHERIRNGERNGRVTPEEADRLYREQRRLARMERDFRADGHLSAKEREILEAAYNDASDSIFRFKHNRYFDDDWGRRYDDHGHGGYDHHSQDHHGNASGHGRDTPYASWNDRDSRQVGWDDHGYAHQGRDRRQGDWHH